MAFKLSKMAKCIKQLEIIKWNLMAGKYDTVSWNSETSRLSTSDRKPKEYYLLNEFPFSSSFCYMFREYRKKNCSGKFCCFCPKAKFIKNSEFSCNNKSDGSTKITAQILDEVESIPIKRIMLFLKKIPLKKHTDKIRLLSSLWNFNVKYYYKDWTEAEDTTTKAVGL